jgi:hypothetical protein
MKFHLPTIFTFLLLALSNKEMTAQTSKFGEVSDKIENLLRYKEKNPSQIRELLTELNYFRVGNEAEFLLLKERVNNVLLPIDIKYARSDVYNKKFKEAVSKVNAIKVNYAFNKSTERLESYLDRKLFTNYKRLFLKSKPTWFSIEPSVSFYTSEVRIKNLESINNLNPVYGLGLYFKTNKREKFSKSGRYSFSQIGVKLDYRDPMYVLLKDSMFTTNSPYFNPQISYIFRKTLGLEAGIMSFSKKLDAFSNLFSFTGSVYIPMRILSIGFNARFITDFQSTNPLFQLGTTIKLNLGLYKPFTSRDREEIRSQITKFKESR